MDSFCISVFCFMGLFVFLVIVIMTPSMIIFWVIDRVDELFSPKSTIDDDDYEDLWYPFD